jgi:16S rRNA (cytidine1402-2'-O)-methyltransferase
MNLHEMKLMPGLYLIATPIGNLRDISLRALDTLNAVDMIMCEDTRVTGKLLKAYDISKPLRPYNDHSDKNKRHAIVTDITAGKSIALVSDAGMPLISDPGYKLVRDCLDLGLHVTSLPGANAPLTALQLSGLPSNAFSFIGFLPQKTKARCDHLAQWQNVPGTLLAFETGPRLQASLEDILNTLGDRQMAVVREITKMYEESRRGSVSELIHHYTESGAPKGEIVLVIEPAAPEEYNEGDIDEMLAMALKDNSTKEAAKIVAEKTGRPRKDIYERALQLQK